jgi:hypothetical protein
MKEQTAVEWMIKEIESLITIETFEKWKAIKEQAKQMEKEQIIDACLSNKTIPSGIKKLFEMQAEKYYNETYGPK